MFIPSEEVFYLTLSYIIPGFLINTLVENSLYLKRNTLSTAVLNYLIFTLINIAFCTLIDALFFELFKAYIVKNIIFITFFKSIVSPVLIWMIIIKFYRIKIGERILNAMGLSKVSLTDSAWDYLFQIISQKGGAYITVVLRDYNEIHGYLGEKSFISSHKEGNNEIYFEEVFLTNEFAESSESGMLIYEKDILAIHYGKVEE